MRVSMPSSRYFFEKSPGVFISRANLIAQTPEEELEADKILQLASGDGREYGVYYDPSSEANLSRGKIAEWQWVLVHLSCCISTLLAGYDASSLAVVQVFIFDAFPNIQLLFVVAAASSLGSCCTAPLLRHFMDMVDLRRFRVFAAFVFLAGSLVAGTATKVEILIVGRTLTGAAIAGLQMSLVTYNTLLATPMELSRLHLASVLGYAIGLVLGASTIVIFTMWRWVFFLGGIMAAVVAVLAALSYPSVTVQPEDKMLRALADIDWIGAMTHSLSFVLFDVAFLLSGSKWAWNSVEVISIWVAILVLFVFSVLQHGYGFWIPGDRILPLGVLQNRIGLGSLFVVAATAGSLSVMLYGIALFCAFVRGEEARQIAVHLLPALGCFGVTSIMARPTLQVVRRPAVLYLCGGICVSAGSGGLMWIKAHTSPGIVIGISCLLGSALGLMSGLSMPVLEANLPSHLRNGVSVCLVTVTHTFTTLPLALAGCIYLNRGYHNLLEASGGMQIPSAEVHQALAGLRSPLLNNGLSGIPIPAIKVASASIMDVFAIGIAAGIAMMAAAFIDGFRPWPLQITDQES
ncbi:MFS general substrate transporter [Apiospora saccharicola]|uniref:MFS general substrate transporter n=1 Tax=Apiospora saccharicola TaxID=335842 RepID=A0ABR1VA60_9PEZI